MQSGTGAEDEDNVSLSWEDFLLEGRRAGVSKPQPGPFTGDDIDEFAAWARAGRAHDPHAYYAFKQQEVVDGSRKFRVAARHLVVGNRFFPFWVEVESTGTHAPDVFARIELDDSRVPRVTELRWTMRDHQREVRQADLRDMQVSTLVNEVYASFVRDADPPVGKADELDQLQRQLAVKHALEALRSPGKRRVTGDFLREVADVYRANIDHAPTQAVARTYGVKLRQAGDYVKKARDRGFLPETKQGRAKA